MLAAFQPQGNSLLVSSTVGSATAAVQTSSAGGIQGLRISNLSTNDAYVSIGASTATATLPTTTVPSTGTGFVVMQRSAVTITAPPNCWLSAITSAGQANLVVTPGVGL